MLQADGGMRTGRDVVIAALLGAEEVGASTAPLVALGCIMMRVCHLNTCPVGIATQDEELRRRFAGKPEHVIRFFTLLAEDVRAIMAGLGISRFADLVGRVDLLRVDRDDHWKASGLDLTPLLAPGGDGERSSRPASFRPEAPLDDELIAALPSARLELPITNRDRTVGGMLSGEIIRREIDADMKVTFRGSAGQSFGAWLAPGVELTVYGDVNDYAGKGLSGGVIAVRPDASAPATADEDVIAGNTTLYGATSGRAFFRGVAGERFAVRNSGADAVVEGVGDHCCEYMTGGHVVVLGVDRAQLRGGHERRDRLRARPRRRRSPRAATRPWSGSMRSTPATTGCCTRCCSSTASGRARAPRRPCWPTSGRRRSSRSSRTTTSARSSARWREAA